MTEVVVFEKVNAGSAGIDIGSEKIFVSTTGADCVSYGTFTQDYRRCVQDLQQAGIEQVAMEATGVYWIALYELLERAGIGVCLVNPKETRQVKGRKTDVKDCQWIQKVFSAGLLHASYIPAGCLKELRMLVRERQDLIEMGSVYVNKMQKCLELMNIKLGVVLSQIQGKSSIAMIEAILAGERNPQHLLNLCDPRIIRAKGEQVLQALEGNYTASWLFMLEQNLLMWRYHEQQIRLMDAQIDRLLQELGRDKSKVVSSTPAKPVRHHKPMIADLHEKLLTIYGIDVNVVPGLNDYTLLRLLGETGWDMSRFPTVKHFVSWCQLAPAWNQSGKKRKSSKLKNGSRAGQLFREAAQSLAGSKYVAIGAFIRRLRSRKGPAIAIKAGARKIAEVFYHLLTRGKAYVEVGVRNYEQQLRQRELKNLNRLAHKHNLQLVENK
jgi:transposase